MTPQTSAAAHLTLDPATADVTLAMTYAALRLDPERSPAQHQTQREAAAAFIAALHPRDPTEASYAARAVAAHYGSMECLRRAALPDTPDTVADRLYGKALALSRMSTDMVRTLRQCQAETPRAQPHPAAQPSMPAPPLSAAAPPPAAATPENPIGRQHPMSSERPSPATPAAPASRPETAATAQRPATAAPTPPTTGAKSSQAGLATEHPPAELAAHTASAATALAA
jgi:hypothetical protein